jgi:phosphotransferase system IIB component
MGSKYSSLSASGFNSSPPADDASQTAANLVTWAGVKTKLADPVKNLADAVNTALVTAFDYSVRQITSGDSIAASDHMKTVEIAPTVSASVSVTLADAATMTSNFIVRIRNSSTIAQSITRATGADTIDGVAGVISIPAKSSVILGTNAAADGYLTLAQSAPTGDFPAGLTTAQTLTNKTLTSPVLNTGVSGTAIADQTAMEAASSTSLVVTPGRQHFHPSAAKAWGMVTPNTTVNASYPAAGVSVVKNGTGDFTVTFGVTFSAATYSSIVTLDAGSSRMFLHNVTKTTTTLRVVFTDESGVAKDPATFDYAIFGDI